MYLPNLPNPKRSFLHIQHKNHLQTYPKRTGWGFFSKRSIKNDHLSGELCLYDFCHCHYVIPDFPSSLISRKSSVWGVFLRNPTFCDKYKAAL